MHSIRLINNETKLYAMHSRLHGLEFAAGDYCMFADGDDDVIGTQNLEKALREVSAKQFDIGHFRVRGSDKYGKELFKTRPIPPLSARSFTDLKFLSIISTEIILQPIFGENCIKRIFSKNRGKS